MEQVRLLCEGALNKNQKAFAQCLFVEACGELSIALNCAFDLRDIVRLEEVELCIEQQTRELKACFALENPLLESPAMSNYSALVTLAATYYALLQDGQIVITHFLGGHKFEEVTTIDPHSKTPQSLYTIDSLPTEPGTWESKRQAGQEHKEQTARDKE
ncbi:MAG: hypothetical protein EOO38_04280 [Cytophagaceae bacterium]|nr:MAG: hypothetical protein EOO38_04280 [Cytophagaceae bacterium]